MAEHAARALREAAALAGLDRLVVRVRGRAPLAFLHDTTTQDLAGLRPGRGALTCLLNEKGRVLAEARVLPLDEGDVLLDAEPAARPGLVGWLGRVAALSGCEVEDETSRWEATAVAGPRAAEAVAALGPPPASEHAFATHGGVLVVRVEWGVPGYDLLGPKGTPLRLDLPRAPAEEYEAARIAAGRPRYGLDVTEDLLVNETPLLGRAVSLEKGCYPGQESVARVHNLGRVRRTLVGLRVEGRRVPAPGERVLAGGGDAGRVTSSGAWDGGAVAIALVRAEVTPGSAVSVGGARGVARALD